MPHETPNGDARPRVGVYVCHCGTNIAGTIDVEDLAAWAGDLPDVAVSRDYKYMCSDPGQALIANDIQEHRLSHVVVAACSPTLHESTFRRAIARGRAESVPPADGEHPRAGLLGAYGPAGRTAKAKDLVRAAVRRVALHTPLTRRAVKVNPNVLVVGGGIAGIHAALTLANAGKEVYLVERGPSIGGHMAQFDKTFPTLDCAACILTPKMTRRERPPEHHAVDTIRR